MNKYTHPEVESLDNTLREGVDLMKHYISEFERLDAIITYHLTKNMFERPPSAWDRFCDKVGQMGSWCAMGLMGSNCPDRWRAK